MYVGSPIFSSKVEISASIMGDGGFVILFNAFNTAILDLTIFKSFELESNLFNIKDVFLLTISLSPIEIRYSKFLTIIDIAGPFKFL